MELADQQWHVLGIHEFREGNGQALAAEELEQRTDTGNDVPRGRNFQCLAGIQEPSLHVHHQQRRATPLGGEHPVEDLAAVGHASLGMISRAIRSTWSGWYR